MGINEQVTFSRAGESGPKNQAIYDVSLPVFSQGTMAFLAPLAKTHPIPVQDNRGRFTRNGMQ